MNFNLSQDSCIYTGVVYIQVLHAHSSMHNSSITCVCINCFTHYSMLYLNMYVYSQQL